MLQVVRHARWVAVHGHVHAHVDTHAWEDGRCLVVVAACLVELMGLHVVGARGHHLRTVVHML